MTRKQALVKTLNVDDTMTEDEFPAANTRRSPWSELLDELWERTLAGDVPLDDNSLPQFIRLGGFKNANGARTQIRALEKKGYDVDYEFKSVTSADGSALWGRALITN